jgi:putative MATE family efflux protein
MTDTVEIPSAPTLTPAAAAPRGLHDMTQGSVRGHVVRMTLFVLAGLTVQALYTLVDIYWVGRLGKEAIAAVALSTNVAFVALAVTQMLGVGCTALVSQAAGRKDQEQVQRFFNQAQSLSTCSGVVFFVVCFALRRRYAEGLSGDSAVAALSMTFLTMFIPALALQFTMIGLGSSLRGIGDMKPGLIAQTLSVLLNMVLAPFFIFGWIGGHPLGVAGAALATLLSTFAAVVGLVLYLVRGKTYLRLRPSGWRPDWGVWGRMVSIGLPAGLEFLVLSIMTGVVYLVTRPFGAEAQAGFGIASRVMQAGFMPAVAISFSAAAVVGQNFGARAFGRVRDVLRESAKLTIGFMLFFFAVCHFLPDALLHPFSSDPAVIAVGADYLRTVAYNFVAAGLVFLIAGIFQGLGNTWPSLVASALRAVAFVATVFWLSHRAGFAMHTIWLVSVGSVTLQFCVGALLVRRELRLRAPVSGSPPVGADSPDTIAA